ncbi:MAG: T9SS type A sorting domain-containing protein [Bacteroidales bacterium]|nr:T9SS type A sorting domain-containing protein [Bacteroidales bacterium]
MKYLLITLYFLRSCNCVFPQKVTFDYNKNGARTERYVHLPKPNHPTSVAEVNNQTFQDNLVKLYPNPTKNYLQIELKDTDILQIEISDLSGRTLMTISNL